MKGSCNVVECFRSASALAQGLAGVVQCMSAVLLRMTQVDGFEFGISILLGITNIPLACIAATVLKRRSECHDPHQYVRLNRLSVALFWHSALFNAICALVLVLMPSMPSAQVALAVPTRFHRYWLFFLDYVSLASVVVPAALVVLFFCCLLTLTGSPLRSVVPSRESLAYPKEAKAEYITLRPYRWVYHDSNRTAPGETRVGRKPHSLISHDDVLYPPPRYTFSRSSGSGGTSITRAQPSQSRDGVLPGCSGMGRLTRGTSSDDFGEDDALDSFVSVSFDDSAECSATGHNCHKEALFTKPSGIKAQRGLSTRGNEGERPPQLRRVAAVNRGEDSLANLTNLELIARQWRTSATLRRIWRSSERSASRRHANHDHSVPRD
ncbi:uncharacterized protein LOC144100897 [Amblyomma americanum]